MSESMHDLPGANVPLSGTSAFTLPGQHLGMVQPGNLDLNARPVVRNPNGGYSTVDSVSFTDPRTGHEVLVPQVVGNRILGPQAAWQNYLRTGQHLGVFTSPSAANIYARLLHFAQAQQYGGGR